MWIEVHQSLPTHRKTLTVAEMLDIAPVQVVGHLVNLWLWAIDNAPDGVIRSSATTISRSAQWSGDAKRFVQALTAAELLDPVAGDVGGYEIHDWHDFAGRLIETREHRKQVNRERQKRWRGKNNAPVTRDSHENNATTVPNLTVPNQVSPPGGGDSAREPTPEEKTVLNILWECPEYPRRDDLDLKTARQVLKDYDVAIVTEAWQAWVVKWEEHPNKRPTNIRNSLRNWCRIEKERRDERTAKAASPNGHGPYPNPGRVSQNGRHQQGRVASLAELEAEHAERDRLREQGHTW